MAVELDNVPFSVVRRGYDRQQVEETINRLGAEIEAAVAARAAVFDELQDLKRRLDSSVAEANTARAEAAEARHEIERLRAHVAELSTVPNTVEGMSERLQQMVRIAQDEVNDMRSRATASAAQLLALAQAEADELRERSEAERREFEAERRAAEDALRVKLEESQTRLDQLRAESDGQRARLAAELSERRAQAEKELAEEMEERRAEVLRDLAAQETRQREEAARIIENATQEARTRLADAQAEAQRVRLDARQSTDAAQRELEELRTLQHQIAEQLTSVRMLLDWTLPQLGTTSTPAPAPHAQGVQTASLPIARPPAETREDTGEKQAEQPPASRLGPVDQSPGEEPVAVPSGTPAAQVAEAADRARPTPSARRPQPATGSAPAGHAGAVR